MREWKYIEKDGFPTKAGFYEVAIEPGVTFQDNAPYAYSKENNRIYAYDDGPSTGICYFDGSKFMINSGGKSLNMDYETYLCSLDHIYAWVDVLLPAPKQIYPSKPVTIDPSEYHLTGNQLMNFLKDYKRSYERGYTE